MRVLNTSCERREARTKEERREERQRARERERGGEMATLVVLLFIGEGRLASNNHRNNEASKPTIDGWCEILCCHGNNGPDVSGVAEL